MDLDLRLWRAWIVPSILFAVGCAILWVPQWPPMVDLPQHAGQAALLRDLVLGASPWRSEVWVNLLTPYLLGYALALPLAFVMPVATALKVVLTLAYGAFVLFDAAIGRQLGASPRLAGLGCLGFFGFAYSWGFFPFLVAAPVGLAFLWLALVYARASERRMALGAALAGLGVLLVFSHGLVWLFALGVAATVLLAAERSLWRAALRAWPFAPSLIVAVLMFALAAGQGSALAGGDWTRIDMGNPLARPAALVFYPFGLLDWPGAAAFLLIAAAPWLAGLRPDHSRPERLILAGAGFAVVLLVPGHAWSDDLINVRFALFLPAAWAWLFAARATESSTAPLRGARLDLAILAIGLLALAPRLVEAWRFSAEAADYAAVEARAEPGQRALAMVIDMTTRAGPDRAAYKHFPLWYEVRQHGLVDYNGAKWPQAVVRLRTLAPVYRDSDFLWDPAHFDWRREDAGRYRYLFVRAAAPLAPAFFAGARCPPVLLAARGEWRLFENRPCTVSSPPPAG
jgi:hypothetical protein